MSRTGSGDLPELRFAASARRDRLTGSHVYGYLSCEHRVTLDLFEDPGLAAPMPASLEALLARGRAFEDEIQTSLGYEEPEYPPGDFVAGAAATRELLEQGLSGVAQGVLFDGPWLGIPDLLRREEGASLLGAHHYVVGDVKSSWSSRADQAMQVAFYSRLLGRLQGRAPEYGYLILRSGEEERIDVRALEPVLGTVLNELAQVAAGEGRTRPHRSESCHSCRWREVCAKGSAIDWLPGLSRSTRELLARAGFEDLRQLSGDAAGEPVPPPELAHASFLRAKKIAAAVQAGRAVRTRALRDPGVLRELLAAWVGRDGFDDRRLVFASRHEGSAASVHVALRREDEDAAFGSFLDDVLAREVSILHGPELPAVLARFAARQPQLVPRIQRVEQRCIPALSLVQGAHAFPAPVRDASEAAAWIHGTAPAGEARELRASLASLAAAGETDTLRRLADGELAGLLGLGVLLRNERVCR